MLFFGDVSNVQADVLIAYDSTKLFQHNFIGLTLSINSIDKPSFCCIPVCYNRLLEDIYNSKGLETKCSSKELSNNLFLHEFKAIVTKKYKRKEYPVLKHLNCVVATTFDEFIKYDKITLSKTQQDELKKIYVTDKYDHKFIILELPLVKDTFELSIFNFINNLVLTDIVCSMYSVNTNGNIQNYRYIELLDKKDKVNEQEDEEIPEFYKETINKLKEKHIHVDTYTKTTIKSNINLYLHNMSLIDSLALSFNTDDIDKLFKTNNIELEETYDISYLKLNEENTLLNLSFDI